MLNRKQPRRKSPLGAVRQCVTVSNRAAPSKGPALVTPALCEQQRCRFLSSSSRLISSLPFKASSAAAGCHQHIPFLQPLGRVPAPLLVRMQLQSSPRWGFGMGRKNLSFSPWGPSGVPSAPLGHPITQGVPQPRGPPPAPRPPKQTGARRTRSALTRTCPVIHF